MGPGGVGKSTLVRTLAGANDAQPAMRTWGQAEYRGRPLGTGPRPDLVAQKAELVMATVAENLVLGMADRAALTPAAQRQRVSRILSSRGLVRLLPRLDEEVVGLPMLLQRQVAILRTALAGAGLLCVDEPCSGLDEPSRDALAALLRDEATRRPVLVVSHNQQTAKALGGRVALLAGGRIVETADSEAFFGSPRTEAAKTFVRTGSCALPAPGTPRAHLAPEVPDPTPIPPEAVVSMARRRGPRGFHWVRRGVLAGTPRPGVVGELDHDLDALREVGITTLVTLEETATVPITALTDRGMQGLFFPIDDMAAPDLDAALAFCESVAARLVAGEVVAYHCRAGLGRTGTMLAAQEILAGGEPLEVLEAIRLIQPRWVQSPAQVGFLQAFGSAVDRRLHPWGSTAGP